MKNTLILLIAITLFSCGSLKKEKESYKSESKTSENVGKTDTTHEIGGGFTLKPFDPNKGMVVGKDTLYNTILEKHYYDRTKVVHDTIVKKEEQNFEVDKMHKEKDNTMLFLGIAGIIVLLIFFVVLVILWWISKNLKTSFHN
jgi:hypothetical protein